MNKLTKGVCLLILGIYLARVLMANPVWGDAPYIASPHDLFVEPQAWIFRGTTGGAVQSLLWLSPLMAVYGMLALFLSNALVIKILFIIPGIILGFTGAYALIRKEKVSHEGATVGALVYIVNTYFLLLIDGGVVGIVLAYGLFPWVVLTVRSTQKIISREFIVSALLTIFLTAVDPRITILAVLLVVFWQIAFDTKRKTLITLMKVLGTLTFVTGAVNFYWIYPLFVLGQPSFAVPISTLSLTSLLHTLFAYQSHWPANIFGSITYPAWYWVGVPAILVFALVQKDKLLTRMVGLYLVFAFLAKGTTPPLAKIYETLLGLPWGFVLRDATKFYIPLLLIMAVIVGRAIHRHSKIALPAVLYSVLLTLPFFVGSLQFGLSQRQSLPDVNAINSVVSNGHTVWFPDVYPGAFHSEQRNAMSAQMLTNKSPLLRLNVGSYDRFNYLHSPSFLDWYRFMGIEHIVLSGNPRLTALSEEQTKDWNDLNLLVATTSGLVREKTDTPVYTISNPLPRVLAAKKLYGVVGAPEVERPDIPMVYFEDGTFDPTFFDGTASDSAAIVFENGANETDLAASFVQSHFYALHELDAKWATYTPQEYLESKFQLLMRDVSFLDFDYGKGIAFSTQPDESITFTCSGASPMVLMLRGQTGAVHVYLNDKETKHTFAKTRMSWSFQELPAGTHTLTVKNNAPITALNTVGCVPADEWQKAHDHAKVYVTHFPVITGSKLLAPQDYIYPTVEETQNWRIRVTFPTGYPWIIVTDSYHPLWKLKKDNVSFDSAPLFSMSNVFYHRPEWENADILFIGQYQVRWGMYWTLVSIVVGIIIVLLPKRKV